jgi:D-3-phosphoglycerate dehydrogenase / 2-oxoglutarate reductase
MDLLIIEPLDAQVLSWLKSRYTVHHDPELAFDPAALRMALSQVRAIIAPGLVAFDEAMLLQAPLLRAVGRIHGGAENIDLQACARSGIEVVRSLSATAHAEAEFMISAALSLLRRVPVTDTDGTLVGRELGSCTVGLLGMSSCAKVLSDMLGGFGCEQLAYDPTLHVSDDIWQRWQLKPVSVQALIETADILFVQLPYFSRYQGLLGERLLSSCKADQILISITHSAVFDEAALAEQLHSGRMSAAWLDSLEPGLLDIGRPLHGAPNIQVTPRLASTTRESKLRSAWEVARRIDDLLASAYHLKSGFRPTFSGANIDQPVTPE